MDYPVDDLSVPIIYFSDSDAYCRDQSFEGLLALGAPGSGKSANVGARLAHGFLRKPSPAVSHSGKPILKYGGLILTAKREETENWIAYARATGREDDLIVFNVGSGYFDSIYYEFTRAGRSGGDLEGIISFFATLVSIGQAEKYHGGDQDFWVRASEQLMRNAIRLLDLSGERVSIVNIDRIIKSLPTRPEEHEDEAWQRDSFCAQTMNMVRARKHTLTEDEWSDLEFASEYLFRVWPAYDPRPRSSIEMVFSGMADKFRFNPLNRLFCSGKCSFTPEMAMEQGKIIVVDFPILEYGYHTGVLINVMIKLVFQRAWLRRTITEDSHPQLLWQDEFQYFIVPKFDLYFQQTCRGSRVAVVCLTQNLLNISEALGEDQPGSRTKSLLGNLATKIFLQQNDVDSCNFASDQIGRDYLYLENFSAATGGHAHANFGGAKQLVHVIEPIEVTRLKKPSASNPYAEAIVYQSGQIFEATKTERHPKGQNYLRTFFSRNA